MHALSSSLPGAPFQQLQHNSPLNMPCIGYSEDRSLVCEHASVSVKCSIRLEATSKLLHTLSLNAASCACQRRNLNDRTPISELLVNSVACMLTGLHGGVRATER
jgi:hypothetical protein